MTSGCYYYSTGTATQSAAETACQGLGTNVHLATINSAQAQADATTIVGAINNVWIGLVNLGNGSLWWWIDGTPYNYGYSNWNAGEPNSSTSGYGAYMYPSAKWDDTTSSTAMRYLCQKNKAILW
jgi:hypothetical protein